MTKFRTLGPRFSLDARGERDAGEVVARYPSSYHFQTEGDEIVVYSKPPKTKTDLYDMGTKDHQAIKSLGDLNRLHSRRYPRRQAVRAAR
jgi:hypothetical protein